MPYGTVVTWSEYLGKDTEKELILEAPNSCIEDLRDQVPTEDMIVITHKIDRKTIVHGSLVVEGGNEEKDKIMQVQAGKMVKVKVKCKESKTQSFCNVFVIPQEKDENTRTDAK